MFKRTLNGKEEKVVMYPVLPGLDLTSKPPSFSSLSDKEWKKKVAELDERGGWTPCAYNVNCG